MAAVTDKLKSVVDFFVKGFEDKDRDFFDGMDDEYDEVNYETEGPLAVEPEYSYQSRNERTNDLKVVNHPNYKGYEVVVMKPHSFDDAAQIVQKLQEKKVIVLNLQLLDKIQSQRTIDFVCGAALALNGKPQKVGDLVFIFTPSNVTLSVDLDEVQTKLSGSWWGEPIQ